jgi:hypothetical protein
MQNWRDDLRRTFENREVQKKKRESETELWERKVQGFFLSTVSVAFEELKTELEKYGREVSVRCLRNYASIEVQLGDIRELLYSLRVESYDRPLVIVDAHSTDKKNEKGYVSTSFIGPDYSIISKEQIIQGFLDRYEREILNE